MKKTISTLLLVVAALACLTLISGCKEQAAVLQINDVASDPGAFAGDLTLVGVVNAYAETDPSILGVMDKKELQCTTPNCNKVLLPVKVAGPRPAIGDEIQISGSFVTESWGSLFKASSVEVLANHNLGGQG